MWREMEDTCGYGWYVEGMCEVHVGGVRKCMGDTWKCVCVEV